VSRLSEILTKHSPTERLQIAAMAALFFTVLCAVGIVKPIKNAFALDGLGASKFYQVYFIGAVVVLFVPLLNRLSRRLEWKVLIPGLALFFALDLVAFRIFYQQGSATFGMVFYAWYDLFTAALVTQFFAAAQLVFDASQAKGAYPLVIAGGSVGATVGGAVTGFLAQRVGTPQLLLVAAAIIVVFGLCLPLVFREGEVGVRKEASRREAELSVGEFRRVFSNRHVQLLALMVLLTILVKTMVDFEFNAVTKLVFDTRDAMSAFQGKFNAVTQWLPLLVLLALRPLLPRVGMGLAVFLLPVTMLAASVGLLLFWGVWAASAAKGADAAFRYSAERTGREILYVPVPDEIKIKAKLYIDMAIEKGLGKVLAGLLIMGVLTVISLRQVPIVALGIVGVWLAVAVRVRREYVKSLVQAVRGRFASLDGLFASLGDANTLPVVRQALDQGDPLQVAFTLDLVARADPGDVERLAEPLNRMLGHPSEEIRSRALGLLAREPRAVDPAVARELLRDSSAEVRRLAAGALVRTAGPRAEDALKELLESPDPRTRLAALASLSGPGDGTGEREGIVSAPPASGSDESLDRAAVVRIIREHLARLGHGLMPAADDPGGRLEAVLAAGALGNDPEGAAILAPLLWDPDLDVRRAAIRGAGRLGLPKFVPSLVEALGDAPVRSAARDALAAMGDVAVEALVARISDEDVPVLVRRHLPAALALIPTQASFDALLASYAAPETDQLLDFRTLKALNKLHARDSDLVVERAAVEKCLDRELEAIRRYERAATRLEAGLDGACGPLLVKALREARRLRRECAFRCLALLYPADVMHRCYLALTTGDRRARGNARELLEQTVGREMLRRLGTAVEGEKEVARAAGGTSAADTDGVDAELGGLERDKDRWVGRCARAAARERRAPGAAGARSGDATQDHADEEEMDAIEKVFLLQRVDVLREARTSQLGLLAGLAEELEVEADRELLRQGEPPDALYVIIRGGVRLDGAGEEIVLRDGAAFGTWALIDDSPSLVDARAAEPTRLLRVGRIEFHDLVADHPEFGLDLLQGLARRVRSLAGA
jgi:AAA family ATP:ADP antiporter